MVTKQMGKWPCTPIGPAQAHPHDLHLDEVWGGAKRPFRLLLLFVAKLWFLGTEGKPPPVVGHQFLAPS